MLVSWCPFQCGFQDGFVVPAFIAGFMAVSWPQFRGPRFHGRFHGGFMAPGFMAGFMAVSWRRFHGPGFIPSKKILPFVCFRFASALDLSEAPMLRSKLTWIFFPDKHPRIYTFPIKVNLGAGCCHRCEQSVRFPNGLFCYTLSQCP